ncbi:MAG TPA: flagellar biosynthetic protein FliO [Jatrophihabitans sp.]|nr:flagellar biosynthetic protein FliO [Jatrophihabitans sp.]
MNTIAVIGRMLLALVFVLGVMWLLARWARKPMGAGKADRVMSVLARQQLSRTSSVAVLKVMDRALVLGVTEQGIRLLTETELSPIEDALAVEATSGRSWSLLRPPAALPAGELVEPSEDEDAEPALVGAATQPVSRKAPASKAGALDGSVLSPQTWRQLLNAARELTVRR